MHNTAIPNFTPGLSQLESEYIAGSLLRQVPAVTMRNTNEDVLTLLSRHPEIIGLPVIENNLPVGLINRNIFMDEMAKPYRRDLFARKSCMAFMDKAPLIVNEKLSIQELSLQVVSFSSKTLQDGFIITDQDGTYLGIGSGEDLVRVVSHLQAEKNRLIMESINYASIIQKSFLRASQEAMANCLQDYFLHWEPRDKVGGDYYFCKKFSNGFFIALIDCTGHGVPGAFMTLIMSSFLDHILSAANQHDPASILVELNRKVKTALGQITTPTTAESQFSYLTHQDHSDDGMDCAFCWVDEAASKIVYAGAKLPLLLIAPNNKDITIINGDKKGVGYIDTELDYQWRNHEIRYEQNHCIYITTDGLLDQIGGPKNIAFGKKRFTRLLLENHEKNMPAQQEIILQAFYAYQGKQLRRDDVSVLGFRL